MIRWHILTACLFLAIGIAIGGIVNTVTSPPITVVKYIVITEVSPTPVPTSTLTPLPIPSGRVEMVHVSHYWPASGGVNCSLFVNNQCLSRMANGQPWQEWIGRAAACPPEWSFGTIIILPGGEQFKCLDRGSAIRYDNDGYAWIDLLVKTPPVPFGTLISVVIYSQ